jgi:hypothetical protein
VLLAFGSCGLLFGLGVRKIGARPIPFGVRAAAVIALATASIIFFPLPGELYLAMHVAPFEGGSVSVEEGLDAIVLTYEDGGRLRNFINGQGHGYRPGPIFLAEAVESLAAAPSLDRVLVIGFGAGSAAEAALVPADVRRVTVVELSASLMANLANHPDLAKILSDPRLRLEIEDGRRFLRRSRERYGLILMDPLRTTTAQSNNLHSMEFFALAAERLSPGGVLMVGGLGDSPVVLRTLMAVFPHVRWYQGFALASDRPLHRDAARFKSIVDSFPSATRSSIQAFAEPRLEGAALEAATSGYPVNRDWHPASEYYLGEVLFGRPGRQ